MATFNKLPHSGKIVVEVDSLVIDLYQDATKDPGSPASKMLILLAEKLIQMKDRASKHLTD